MKGKKIWIAFKKLIITLKPIKYVTLKMKYNQLENKYNALLEAEKNKCFETILSQINVPEQIQKKDRRVKQLEKQVKVLKEIIKEEK